MIIWAIIAIYYLVKFLLIIKPWPFAYTTALLGGGMYLLCHYYLEDAWWAEWIVAPIVIYVGYFLMFLRQIRVLVDSVTIIDKEDNEYTPRLNELFGKYQYRDDIIENFITRFSELKGGTREILYEITTDDRYFSETQSQSMMICEAYIYAAEGDYSRAADIAKTICKKTEVKNKEDLLWIYSWIGTDPQLCQMVFDSDGKLKDML